MGSNPGSYWGAKKDDLLKNTHHSIYAVKIYTKQYLYFFLALINHKINIVPINNVSAK